MPRTFVGAIVLAIGLLAWPRAVEAAPPSEQPLIVAVKEAPPFAYRTNGEWTGQSVELWRAVADELGLFTDTPTPTQRSWP